MFFRSVLWLCSAACLLAQTPQPPAPPPPPPAQSGPQPPLQPLPPKASPPDRVVNPDGSITMKLPIGAPLPQVPPEKVILTVGDLTITARQFDEITDAIQEQYKAFVKGPGRKQFADQLVKVLTLAQEGKRRKLDEKSAFQSQVMYQTDQALANFTYLAMTKEVKIDDAALHAYYDAHKADFEQLHARHILIRMHGSTVPVKPGEKDLSDEEALAKAQELEKRIKAGEDFGKLAGAESDDKSATNGGDLGTFGHGSMVPSFDEAAFKLAPGQVSEPVKSQFGYHIIKLESRETKSFEAVKPEIEKKLGPEEAKKAMDALEKSTKTVYDPEFFGMAKQ
jgi:peptidyl-prolyl cis-trans isomerase C